MNDIRKRKFDDRPIDFIDEVRVHLALWMGDTGYKSVNPYIKEAFQQLADALDISATIQRAGGDGNGNVNINNVNAKRLIKMYKDKYLELTDLNCEEDIAGSTFIIISRLAEKLDKEGSSTPEYIGWFFDEFLRQPENRKFIPPNIKLLTSNFMTQKYFYDKKDLFKMRKKDVGEQKRKLELLKVASELFDSTNDEQLGTTLVQFGKNLTTYLKLENSVILVAEKTGDKNIINKINELRQQKINKPTEEIQNGN